MKEGTEISIVLQWLRYMAALFEFLLCDMIMLHKYFLYFLFFIW